MPALNIELMARLGNLGAPLHCVAVQNRRAYLGVGTELVVLDVRDPTGPIKQSSCPVGVGAIRAIAPSAERVYVGGADGLVIIDLAAESPRTLGSYQASFARGIVAAEPYVYLSARCLQVVDVSDPAHPVRAGQWDEGQGAYALAGQGRYLYLGDAGGLRVFDVAVPTAPREVGECNTAAFPEDAALAGKRLYLASEYSGLRIVDISDPIAPDDIGHFNTWRDIQDSVIDGESGNAQAVAAWGDYAYVVFAGSGLRIIDVTDPMSPAEVGFYPAGAVDVAVDASYIYLAAHSDGLYILRAIPSAR